MNIKNFFVGRAIGFLVVGLIVLGWWMWTKTSTEVPVVVTNFQECVEAGNPVMESYPRQCRHDGETFTEFVGNEVEKLDLIRLENPRPNQTISSPTVVTGEARGYWYFEATFPIVVVDWDGRIVGEGYAEAQSEWMTEDFVPFTAEITWTLPEEIYSKRGSLILQKSNASGLPEHDDALEIPIVFE